MKLLKTISVIAVFTLASLLYVHQQVELVKLSYAIETREKKIKELLDHKQRLDYNINNLESPSRLEKVLTSKNIEMIYPNRQHIVKVAKLPAGKYRGYKNTQKDTQKLSLFGWVDFFSSRAEAQAIER